MRRYVCITGRRFRRSFIVLKENKSAFFCVICVCLRPVNTSKHTVKSSFTGSLFLSFAPLPYGRYRRSIRYRLPSAVADDSAPGLLEDIYQTAVEREDADGDGGGIDSS